MNGRQRSLELTRPHMAERWRLIECTAPLVLVIAVGAAYSNSFHGEFVFDDLAAIPENPHIRSLSPLGTVLFPPADRRRTTDGRPLVSLSLAVNYALGRLEVEGYHLFNLLVHIGATLALFGVVHRTLLLPRWPEDVSARAIWLALAIALLWGLHPLQTESVTYLIQRAESMVGLFFLLTIYAAIRAWESRWAALWGAAAVICCAAGMATKEVMATVPLVVLLYDRVFLFPSIQQMFARRWALYAGLASTWLFLLVLIASSEARGDTVGFGKGIAPLEYLATQFGAIVHYLRLSVVPYPLVLDYGTPVAKNPGEILPYMLIVAALAIGTLVGFRFQPWIGFLGTCFFLILAPSSSIVPIVTQTMAEHRMYLPLAAVIALAVVGIDYGWRRAIAARQSPALRLAPIVMLCVAALCYGALTWRRNVDYRTAKTIWLDTLAKRPENMRPHANLAEIYLAEGKADAALQALDRCIELDPTTPGHYYNRATVLLVLNRIPEAIEDFTTALEMNPDDADCWHNRGLAFQVAGDHEQAVADFTRALELRPGMAVTYESRARSWQALGELDQAESDLRIRRSLPESR